MVDEIMAYRYREYFHMSYQEFQNEPLEAVNFARMMWSLEKEKEAVAAKRNVKS
ncbi:hypothetical protein [uncultured Kocuria sp.]|uniref:hypothetical protein n=1 Tax=uncultured Kocuria sp. TaxID=259305 RepID=UPI00263024FD|nr:hypothetical protein [uncultured Kocuria sp.]